MCELQQFHKIPSSTKRNSNCRFQTAPFWLAGSQIQRRGKESPPIEFRYIFQVGAAEVLYGFLSFSLFCGRATAKGRINIPLVHLQLFSIILQRKINWTAYFGHIRLNTCHWLASP
ncbi:UNVERIFIED_CONTAM: hypothetical protein NCL1_16863 [Trichonephila clavipes]